MGRIFALSALIFALGYSTGAFARDLEVCLGCTLGSIAAAVAQAAPGDTILVQAGTYLETEIAVDKALAISAAPGAHVVVNGAGHGSVFLVKANGVRISGLVIRGSGTSYTEELAGIKAMEVSDCRFTGNTLAGDTYGIYLGNVSKCLIRGNQITGEVTNAAAGGNGIHLWHCNAIEIEGNRVTGHRDGIYFEFVENSHVRANESFRNLRYGLHFMYSSHDEYEGNIFRENISGVAVMYSKGIRIHGNLFQNSLGSAAYGILLKEISDSELRANRFVGNTLGAYLEGANRLLVVGNLFAHNGWALRILGDADGNSVIGNDFLENTFDLTTNATRSTNRFYGNYWSQYRGIDFDRNGVGDSPFYPVRLSSLLMESYAASVLLTRSFFFSVLDEAEGLLPILTPAAFRDDAPQMRRVTSL